MNVPTALLINIIIINIIIIFLLVLSQRVIRVISYGVVGEKREEIKR